MVSIRPFRALRPIKELAAQTAALPYDVVTSAEARALVKDNPYSFLRIDKAEVGITNIDGFCSKLRERISCFARKARSFAKKKLCIEQRLEIFSIQHNFIEAKKGKTPAMKEGLINKPLSWSDFFNIRLATLI